MGKIVLKYRHKLLCGDSTDEADVEKLMCGEKADMVFTSPPYGLGTDRLRGGFKKTNQLYNEYKDETEVTKELCRSVINIAIKNSTVVFWNIQLLSKNKKWFFEVLPLDKLSEIFIWTKSNPPPGSNEGIATSSFEFIFCFSNDANLESRKIPGSKFKGHEMSTVYHSSVNKMDLGHKAAFSIEFVLNYIDPIDPKTVLDLFLGSGSTLIACEKTNRRCFGLEIDPHYCSVIIKRWETYTNERAIRLENIQ